jgi:hypothetical protein
MTLLHSFSGSLASARGGLMRSPLSRELLEAGVGIEPAYTACRPLHSNNSIGSVHPLSVVSQRYSDQLLIGNAVNAIGHGLRKQLIQRNSFEHGQTQDL